MKSLFKIIFLISILNQGCENAQKVKEGANQFSALADTLIIQTEKQRGQGLFNLGVAGTYFQDTSAEFSSSVVYPKDLENIMRMQMKVDWKAENPQYVEIMQGLKGEKSVVIVDENNNKDFTDDSVRIPQQIDWNSSKNLIKLKYFFPKTENVVEDSSWLKLGISNGRLMYGRNEHLTADFSIDERNYQVGIIDFFNANSFTYDQNPEITLLNDNPTVKDSLFKKDLLIRGEYLNLDGDYYRFESISKDGKQITLIKEKHFDEQVGTQVGMIAPEFKGVTTDGDTIDSSNLHDKIIVIANSCGCGGDVESTDAYFQIKKEYGNKVYALHLDSKIEEGLVGRKIIIEKNSNLHIDMQDEFNKDLYSTYRKFYCSRTTYVIDENKRILDKFEVTDWKSFLPIYVEN